MLKLLSRAWKYVVAALSGKLDEKADPKVQIEQAIQEAKRQHELLSQQAAAVLGNRKQLELKLARSMDDVEKLKSSAHQALMLSDQSTKAGDAAKATQYEETAQAFANKLVASESTMKDLMTLHEQAMQSAEAAKRAVEQNAYALEKKLTERSKLLSQLEHAKMQEQMNQALRSVSELTAADDVPTFSEVREKIEGRYARALGQAEITGDTVEARMLEVEKASMDSEGKARLDEIRVGMALDAPATAPAIEQKTSEQ